MQERMSPIQKVKPIAAYLKEAVKFYDLDKPAITQFVFVIQLLVTFGSYLLMQPYTLRLIKYANEINMILPAQKPGMIDFTFLYSDSYPAIAEASMKLLDAFLAIIAILILSKIIVFFVLI